MPEDIEPVPVFAPGEGYEPARPSVPNPEPRVPPKPGFVPTAIYSTAVVHDPDDKVGARCHEPGPTVPAEGKEVVLVCVRRRSHEKRGEPTHRCFAGVNPLQRVWYEWT